MFASTWLGPRERTGILQSPRQITNGPMLGVGNAKQRSSKKASGMKDRKATSISSCSVTFAMSAQKQAAMFMWFSSPNKGFNATARKRAAR